MTASTSSAPTLEEMSVDEKARVIERIRGLLAKGYQTTNEHEQEAFLAKAQELLLRYNLAESQVYGGRAKKSDMKKYTFDIGEGGDISWRRQLIYDIAKLNFVAAVYDTGTSKVHLVGEQHNVQVVQYLFVYVSRNILRAATKKWELEMRKPSWKRASHNGRAFKNAFYHGAVAGVRDQMTRAKKKVGEETANNMALVVVKDQEVEDAKLRFFPNLRKGQVAKVQDNGGWETGYAEGKSMPIQPAVTRQAKAS